MSTIKGIVGIERPAVDIRQQPYILIETDSKRRPCCTFSRSCLGQQREKEGKN
jgi:hypothetical protein